MKFFTATKPHGAAVFLGASLLSGALALGKNGLRRIHDDGQQKGEHRLDEYFNVLGDWNVETLGTMMEGNLRVLSPLSSMDECIALYPTAFCICVINDGNPVSYCSACGTALVASGFDLSQTSRFNEWFTDESQMHLAQTGTYKGAAGITEYVNFLYSIFLTKIEILGTYPKFIRNDNFDVVSDPNYHVCTIAVAYNKKNYMNPQFSVQPCVQVTVGSSIKFRTPSTRQNALIDVIEANVWYPDQYTASFFGLLIKEVAVGWVCKQIRSNCTAVYDFNNFGYDKEKVNTQKDRNNYKYNYDYKDNDNDNDNENMDKCAASYTSLPMTEGNIGYIDGKSLGCKILHASFVAKNQQHCPHTSFKPLSDSNGIIKCQTSHGTLPEDIFSSDVISFFEYVSVNLFKHDPVLFFDPDPAHCLVV